MFTLVYLNLWSFEGGEGLISSGLAITAELGRYLIGPQEGGGDA